MARTLNPDLAPTLLAAAKALWNERGDAGFDLRTVAARARTTTATLYTRFDSRDDILRALRDECLAEFYERMQETGSIMELCSAYLDFAERAPRDYELMFGSRWQQRSSQFDLEHMIGRLVVRIDAEVHCASSATRDTALQVWLQLHGTATVRLSSGDKKPSKLWQQLRASCLSACETLVRTRR
jgi:AcrR family transcriptional regulator